MRDDHPIPLARLRLIRERGPDWENAWWELWAKLESRIVAIVKSRGLLEEQADVEDFVAEYMLELYSKARDGRLLINWDEDSSVMAYLTAIISVRVVDMLKRRTRELACATCGTEDESPLDREVARRRLPEELQRRLDVLFGDSMFRVPVSGPIDRALQHLGVQHHPRIEWEKAEHRRLRDCLVEVLVHERPGWPPRNALLDHEHHEAAMEHRQTLDRRAEKRERACAGRGTIEVQTLERKIDKTIFEMYFMPLSAQRLMRLFAITRANADQLRRRMRQKRLDQFPKLRDELRQVLELDAAGDELLDELEDRS